MQPDSENPPDSITKWLEQNRFYREREEPKEEFFWKRGPRIPALKALAVPALAIYLVVGLAMYFWVHGNAERLTFWSVGFCCFIWAWMVWRYEIIGYKSWDKRGAMVVRSPLSRSILVPLLLIVGLVLVGAAMPTGVGSVLAVPAHIGAWTYDLIATTWNLALVAAIFGCSLFFLITGISRGDRDRAAAGTFLLLFLAGALALGYLLYAIGLKDADTYHDEWNSFLKPVHVIAELFD